MIRRLFGRGRKSATAQAGLEPQSQRDRHELVARYLQTMDGQRWRWSLVDASSNQFVAFSTLDGHGSLDEARAEVNRLIHNCRIGSEVVQGESDG